jgi:hypothetical protein
VNVHYHKLAMTEDLMLSSLSARRLKSLKYQALENPLQRGWSGMRVCAGVRVWGGGGCARSK